VSSTKRSGNDYKDMRYLSVFQAEVDNEKVSFITGDNEPELVEGSSLNDDYIGGAVYIYKLVKVLLPKEEEGNEDPDAPVIEYV